MDITQKELMNLFSVVGSVENSDMFLLYSPNTGTTAKVTAEILRAYLNKGFEIGVSDAGTLVIGGIDTGKNIECVVPQMRGGDIGIEVSYDNGETWQSLVTYVSIGLNPAMYQNQIKTLQDNKAEKTEVKDVSDKVDGVSAMFDGMKLHKPMDEEAWQQLSSNTEDLDAFGIYMTFEE